MLPESSVIFFPCKSMERTRDYYTRVVGLPVYKDLGHTVWFDCGYGYIAYVEYGDGREPARGACVSFNLPSREAVDRQYRLMLSRDGVLGLQGPPRRHPRFPVYSFFFSDPDGGTLEFQKTEE